MCEDVLFEWRLQEGGVQIRIDRREPQGRLPVVLREGQGRALSVVVRAEDDEGARPGVSRKGRVTVRRDGTRVHVARMRHYQADEAPIAVADFRDSTGAERVRVTFPNLAHEGVAGARVKPACNRRVSHGRVPVRGTL